MTIKEARLCAELTQEEMSEIFGMRQQTIESLESGKKVLSRWIENLIIDKLLLIAKNKETTKRRKHYEQSKKLKNITEDNMLSVKSTDLQTLHTVFTVILFTHLTI